MISEPIKIEHSSTQGVFLTQNMGNLDKRFNELISIIKNYSDNANLDKVRDAFEFAKLAHAEEKRLSGREMIWHPLETTAILAAWKMDEATIIAGLLHDTVEHGAATEKDILDNFGPEVLELVMGVTKVSKLKLVGSLDDAFVENLRKMFLAIAKDLRVVFLRLAERIDNLKSLDNLPEQRRKNYSIESLEIYGPLAERLGMWEAKSLIDDHSFKFAYPSEYAQVVKLSRSYYENAEKRILEMKRKLLIKLQKEGMKNFKLETRKKGYYSLWKKLQRPEIQNVIVNIHDTIAMRILVEEINDCYKALGVLHSLYKPSCRTCDFRFYSCSKTKWLSINSY